MQNFMTIGQPFLVEKYLAELCQAQVKPGLEWLYQKLLIARDLMGLEIVHLSIF